MDNCSVAAGQSLKCSLDQLLPSRGQHLNAHIGWNSTVLNQFADEAKIRLGSRGKANFNFLKTELDQQVSHTQFLLHGHRLNEGLVAIAQIN